MWSLVFLFIKTWKKSFRVKYSFSIKPLFWLYKNNNIKATVAFANSVAVNLQSDQKVKIRCLNFCFFHFCILSNSIKQNVNLTFFKENS